VKRPLRTGALGLVAMPVLVAAALPGALAPTHLPTVRAAAIHAAAIHAAATTPSCGGVTVPKAGGGNWVCTRDD
jgi:hypothetical protein